METHGKRGFLLENFRLFHLKSGGGTQVEYHYHEFCKISPRAKTASRKLVSES